MMSNEKYSIAWGDSIVPRPFVHNNRVFDDLMHTIRKRSVVIFFLLIWLYTPHIKSEFFVALLHNNNNNGIVSILLLLCQPFSPLRQQHSLLPNKHMNHRYDNVGFFYPFSLSLSIVWRISNWDGDAINISHNVYLNLNATHPFCFEMMPWHQVYTRPQLMHVWSSKSSIHNYFIVKC